MKDFLENILWIANTQFNGDIEKAVTTLMNNYRKQGEARCDLYMKIQKGKDTNSHRASV